MDKTAILITPDHTLVGDEILQPTSITVVLENGHAYELEYIVTLLMKADKRNQPKRPSRVKRFFHAVKQAMAEAENISTPNENKT